MTHRDTALLSIACRVVLCLLQFQAAGNRRGQGNRQRASPWNQRPLPCPSRTSPPHMCLTVRCSRPCARPSRFHTWFTTSTPRYKKKAPPSDSGVYRVWLKKPNYFRLENDLELHGTILIGDGSTLWLYWPNGRSKHKGEDAAVYEKMRLHNLHDKAGPARWVSRSRTRPSATPCRSSSPAVSMATSTRCKVMSMR